MSRVVCQTCSTDRTRITRAQGEVARLARAMARSERSEERLKPRLVAAKSDLATSREQHEMHLAVCEGVESSPHGSLGRYSNSGCRCDDCRQAHRDYQHQRRSAS